MIGSQLLQRLAAREAADTPLRVGIIGVGKFRTMFLSQARRISGLHGLGVADLASGRPRQSLRWADVAYEATDPVIRFRREMEQQFPQANATS